MIRGMMNYADDVYLLLLPRRTRRRKINVVGDTVDPQAKLERSVRVLGVVGGFRQTSSRALEVWGMWVGPKKEKK